MTPPLISTRTQVNPTPCHVWLGALNSRGYPLVSVDGAVQLAHREAWEWENGVIPGDLTIDHLCLVTRCVNVDHMQLAPRAENSALGNSRRVADGLAKWGVTHCPAGHDYDEANTYRNSKGHRFCRTCKKARDRAIYAKKVAARQAEGEATA